MCYGDCYFLFKSWTWETLLERGVRCISQSDFHWIIVFYGLGFYLVGPGLLSCTLYVNYFSLCMSCILSGSIPYATSMFISINILFGIQKKKSYDSHCSMNKNIDRPNNHTLEFLKNIITFFRLLNHELNIKCSNNVVDKYWSIFRFMQWYSSYNYPNG